jgi:hypothetical protein
VRRDSQFRHGNGGDGKLGRQLAWIDEFEIEPKIARLEFDDG